MNITGMSNENTCISSYKEDIISTMSKIGIDARLWDETGVGRYIRNLVKELQVLDQKNNYVLFVLAKDKEVIEKAINLSTSLREHNKWSVITTDIRWHSLSEQLTFAKILENENLDLVHFPYFSVPMRYNRPYVVTIHDLILHHFPTGKASTLPTPLYYLKHYGYKFVISQAAKKAKKIITVSESTAKQIVTDLHIKREEIVVTYEGVDERFMKDLGFKNYYGKYFLYVGNVYPHKNAEKLLEAFKEFTESTAADVKLLFVGKEDYFYKRLKRKVAQVGLTKDVLFKQNISDEELAHLYQNACALVVPSLMEGFGLPGLEAMANRCLVVASNIPSLREIYEDAALYCEPTSIESIAEMLKKVYGMETQEKEFLRKKGKEQVKKFSWKDMAAQTLAVYESSIGL